MMCVIRTPLVVNTVSRPARLLHFIDTGQVYKPSSYRITKYIQNTRTERLREVELGGFTAVGSRIAGRLSCTC